MHVWSDATPLEETLSALDIAVSSGRASYVGVCNYSGWQTAQAATWQRAVPGRAVLAINPGRVLPAQPRASRREVLPAAAALGLGILPWSPLGRGMLTGKYRRGTPADSRGASAHFAASSTRYSTERTAASSRPSRGRRRASGWTPLEVALAWVRDRPGSRPRSSAPAPPPTSRAR